MPEESWTFRTAKGSVTVRDDAVAIRSTPRRFLAGQRARWRHGDGPDRARVAFDVAGLPFLLFLIAINLHTVGEAFPGPSSVFLTAMTAVTLLSSVHGFWRTYLRERVIPLSDIETVVIDVADETITFDRGSIDGPLSVVRREDSETTFAFPTAEDRREAREVLQLRGIAVEFREDGEVGETTYRVTTEKGACFCERCESQVSPADRTCPACGYELHVQVEEDTTTGRSTA